MTFLEQMSAVRRRWPYLLLGLLVGAVAGFLTAPGLSGQTRSFEATHTLLAEDAQPGRGAGINLEQTALLVLGGDVPERVLQRLDEAGDPPPEELTALPVADVGSLSIRAVSSSASGAENAANFAAEELIAAVTGAEAAALEQERTDAQTRVDALAADLNDIEARLAPLVPEDPARVSLEAERGGLLSSLQSARQRLDELNATNTPKSPLRTLEAATGGPLITQGWRIPDSRPVRAGLFGAFGLLLGIAGALAAEHLDTRVRNKADAERAFDLPVVAEVPPLPAGSRGRELLVVTRPAAAFVESYRALRTVVLFATEQAKALPHPPSNGAATNGAATNGAAPNGGPTAAPAGHAQVLLLTSPSAGEGKTTSAAHLAAVLAEFGKRVLVISADFRRPRIHELFGVPREPGLSDVLDSAGGRARLSDLQMSTSVNGVYLLPSGGPVDNPAQLLTETTQLIGAAKTLFDFIIVDTPPLLVANDATELAAVADMVILLAKADRTNRDSARRATEILRRVDAPILGAVLVSAHDTPTAYGYYRYRYYADADQGAGRLGSGRRRKRATPRGPDELQVPVPAGATKSDEL